MHAAQAGWLSWMHPRTHHHQQPMHQPFSPRTRVLYEYEYYKSQMPKSWFKNETKPIYTGNENEVIG